MPDDQRETGPLLLALNLGNTNLGCAFFSGSSVVHRLTIALASLDQSGAFWERLPAELLGKVSLSALASVNPPRTPIVVQTLAKRLGKSPRVLGSDLPVPVVACVEEPAKVGADRLLNVLAAYHHVRTALIVVDFGTAVTFDVCSSSGEFLGGVIAPGLQTSAAALNRATALLPNVHITPPRLVTGRNTEDAIRSGVFWGQVATLEGLVARLRAEHPSVRRVLATGGDAPLVVSATSVVDEIVPNLTFEGIRLAVQAAGLTP